MSKREESSAVQWQSMVVAAGDRGVTSRAAGPLSVLRVHLRRCRRRPPLSVRGPALKPPFGRAGVSGAECGLLCRTRGWASLLLAGRSRPPFSDHDGMGPAFLGSLFSAPVPRGRRGEEEHCETCVIARETCSAPVRRESESGSVASESSSLA